MKNIKQAVPKGAVAIGKQRSYNEVIEFLDKHWKTNSTDKALSCAKQLDKAFGNLAQGVNAIVVGGTNGKSLTINFATQLLKQEGLSVGAFYSPHTLTYNERFSLNNEAISNKEFTEIANDVINTAETLGLTPNSFEVLTIMALLYFKNNNADVALLEMLDGITNNAVALCNPKIAAITRVTNDELATDSKKITAKIKEMTSIVQKDTHVISADQNKANLQAIADATQTKGATWAMPIRKLAPLVYPMEQLHGRCAALAERVADIYINTFANKNVLVVSGTLLSRQKGQRGRPTLEAKRQLELNPKKTIEQFWKETSSTLPGKFQLLGKEKPSILLDTANNLDAFKNLLLGVRLLHYQRPLKGLTLILGCNNKNLDTTELLKALRYFFKKTSGQVIVCPTQELPGEHNNTVWDVEKITNDLKSMKIKAKASKNFAHAFEMAQKSVDERNGLVVIAGSQSVVTDFWKNKGLKKI